jgi:hypothetical protein
MNGIGGVGLWDEEDGFYYDQLYVKGKAVPLKIRSMVGIIPLFACELLEHGVIERMGGFTKRMRWFMENRKDLGRHISYMAEAGGGRAHQHHLLAIPSRQRLMRVLNYVLDESEFLSPYGVRALSRHHLHNPYVFQVGGEEMRIEYSPGESNTYMFGGNSNWRGPVWFPVNWLLIESLEIYHHFYGDTLRVECPTGSGKMMNLREVAAELAARSSRPTRPAAAPAMGPRRATPTTPTSATSSSSTSTSTATTAAGSEPAIKPAGPRSWRAASSASPNGAGNVTVES